jgi:hypothetical protein
VEDVARNASWDMMETFSRVTKFAQNTTRHVVEHPLARPILPLIPSGIRNMILESVEAETLISEYDSAGHFLKHIEGRITGKNSSSGPVNGAIVMGEIDTTRDFERLAVCSQLLLAACVLICHF